MSTMKGSSVAKGADPWPQFHQAKIIQESRAVARKAPDAAAVLFTLKFADNIHYK